MSVACIAAGLSYSVVGVGESHVIQVPGHCLLDGVQTRNIPRPSTSPCRRHPLSCVGHQKHSWKVQQRMGKAVLILTDTICSGSAVAENAWVEGPKTDSLGRGEAARTQSVTARPPNRSYINTLKSWDLGGTAHGSTDVHCKYHQPATTTALLAPSGLPLFLPCRLFLLLVSSLFLGGSWLQEVVCTVALRDTLRGHLFRSVLLPTKLTV